MRFVHQSVIAAPLPRVFAFHEAPGALERLVPPWERVEVLQRGDSLASGTRVIMKLRLGPLSLIWEAEHTLYEKDKLFQDRQVRGPFASWVHTHRFEATPEGDTRLIDEVDCTPPLGILGRIFGGPFVRARLEKMFAYRHRVTKEACERAS